MGKERERYALELLEQVDSIARKRMYGHEYIEAVRERCAEALPGKNLSGLGF